MSKILRVLNVEDSERDVALVHRYLLQAGYALITERVETPEAMREALKTKVWDVILSDYSMPHFTGLAALELLKETGLDIPFIIISGTIGEKVAVEAMRTGAQDYLMKDNLARLGQVIERELEEARIRQSHKQAEAALKASEAELRALFEAMTDVIMVLNDEGRYLKIAPTNPSLHYSPTSDRIGKTFHEIFPKEKADFFLAQIRSALDEGRMHRVEYNLRIGDREVWFDASISPMSSDSVLWVARDITQRKLAEEELLRLNAQLENQRQRLNNIVASVPGVVWEGSGEPDAVTQRTDFVSGYIEAMLGYSVAEWLSTPNFWLSIIHPDDKESTSRTAAARYAAGQDGTLEFRWIAKDGHTVWVESNSAIITDLEGRPVGLRGITIDVTERKGTESRIREQAELLDIVQDAIFETDFEERFLFWNRAAEEIYGWKADEVLGRKTSEVFNRDSPAGARINKVANQTVREKGLWRGELSHVGKTGKEIMSDSRWTMVFDPERKPKFILHVNSDITEKKQLETQFLRAQRMESIGILAGGIAHDLNNILSPILMSVELLGTKITDEKGQRWIEMLRTSTERGAALIKQILAFARGTEGEHSVLELKHLVHEVEKILKETFPKSITLDIFIDKEIWPVSANVTQLHQVLMNLCVNARDAMPNGGRLEITAENMLLDEHFAEMKLDVTPGPYVVLSVKDTGLGIPPEIREKIFEPFYTTKDIGKGTGLGLSTVIGIVKSHSGFVTVYSEVGRGTQFKVYLPAVETVGIPQKEEVSDLLLGHGELILLIDDEVQIREMTQTTLQNFGYQVLTAVDGAEGLALYVQQMGNIAVVITDMMMPLMDGKATIRAIRRINPEAKIIVSSGFMEGNKLAEISKDENIKFLSKPYSAGNLLTALHEMLTQG